MRRSPLFLVVVVALLVVYIGTRLIPAWPAWQQALAWSAVTSLFVHGTLLRQIDFFVGVTQQKGPLGPLTGSKRISYRTFRRYGSPKCYQNFLRERNLERAFQCFAL